MLRLKDAEGIKSSLRGKKIEIVRKDGDFILIRLLENAGIYKAGKTLLTSPIQIEEVEE